MLVGFSLTCVFQCVLEKFFNLWCSHSSIYGVHKSLNLCVFTHAPVPHAKLLVEFFENLFPPGQKGLEEAMICSVKIQSENMKMTSNISLFPFGMIAIFLNMMTLQFCKQYQIVVLSLLATSSLQPWQFDAKITSENIATLMKGAFL